MYQTFEEICQVPPSIAVKQKRFTLQHLVSAAEKKGRSLHLMNKGTYTLSNSSRKADYWANQTSYRSQKCDLEGTINWLPTAETPEKGCCKGSE